MYSIKESHLALHEINIFELLKKKNNCKEREKKIDVGFVAFLFCNYVSGVFSPGEDNNEYKNNDENNEHDNDQEEEEGEKDGPFGSAALPKFQLIKKNQGQ